MTTRVLHIYSGNLYGGVETMLVTLARCRHLCPQMVSEFALCYEGRLSAELRGAGVPVHILGPARISRPWTVWRARRALARALSTAPFHAVICHASWTHVLMAPVVRAAGGRLFLWLHSPIRGHWLERWAARTPPDAIIANSRFTQNSLDGLLKDVPSTMVYCPVEPPDLPDRAGIREKVRAELSTSRDAVVIVTASRMESWKGHVVLLDALGLLRDVPSWLCWVAGGAQRPAEAKYVLALQAQARCLGIAERVRFLGQRSDIPRVLAAADIHCQANTCPEPFGIAFIEALYAGLPVVTTKMGASPEIVDPSCGILVDAGPASLSSALSKLIHGPDIRKHMGEAGRLKAHSISNPEHACQQLYALFNGVRE